MIDRHEGTDGNRRLLGFVPALLLTLGLCLIALPALADADASEAVAKIGDLTITHGELQELAKGQLTQLEIQKQQLLEAALSQLVQSKLVELEAKARGTTAEELMEKEVAAKIPAVTDEEIDTFYTERGLRQPKEQIADQIRNFLLQERTVGIQKTFLDGLQKKFPVTTLLEPIRFEVDTTGAPIKGQAKAPVTIVEFSDFQCPGCKGVLPSIERLQKDYGDKIKLAFRQFPLRSIHPEAQKAAEASLCARDQGKFWEMHDAMFANQRELTTEGLKSTAGELGLDGEKFAQCLDGDTYADTVQADLDAGEAMGVGGTPTFYVNGRPVNLRGGVDPYDLIAPVIEDELQRQAAD